MSLILGKNKLTVNCSARSAGNPIFETQYHNESSNNKITNIFSKYHIFTLKKLYD